MHPVVRLQVPLQGKRLFTVRAAVLVPAVVDLLVDDEAHQGGVQLATLPALVGLLPLVAPLVGLQVSLLVEASVALGAVDHLPAGVGGAAVDGPAGPDLRMVLCGREFRHGAKPSAVTTPKIKDGRRSQGAAARPTVLTGHHGLPAGGEGSRVSSELSPRDRKSRPSSHRLQSVSLMDTFLRTG